MGSRWCCAIWVLWYLWCYLGAAVLSCSGIRHHTTILNRTQKTQRKFQRPYSAGAYLKIRYLTIKPFICPSPSMALKTWILGYCCILWSIASIHSGLPSQFSCVLLLGPPIIVLWGRFIRGEPSHPQMVELVATEGSEALQAAILDYLLNSPVSYSWSSLPLFNGGTSLEVSWPTHKGWSQRTMAALLCFVAVYIF